jgi:hypothetical protein
MDRFVIGGVYIAPVVPACLLALLITMVFSAVLTRIGFYRLVWHRPLVEVAIFCMVLVATSLPLTGATT